MKLPSNYLPTTVEEFIGPAQAYARLLTNMARLAIANGADPIKVLINGPPGNGKSSLANFLALQLGCTEKHSRLKYNGTQIKVEVVDELARQLAYGSLYGDYNFLWVDEADKIPAVAQVRFLTLLDDLPQGTAVVCTSNCKVKDFEERFQSRFRVIELEAPAPHDIESLLGKFINNPQTIRQIANFACGNVRQALLDADLAVVA